MTAYPHDRWRRIDALYAAALDLPDDERAAFLVEACDGDEALRREVHSLLELELRTTLPDSATGFIPLLMEGARAELEDRSNSVAAGDRIGAWRILEEIGRGGMGAVYLAERADEQFQMRAAVKLIKRGMDTDEILRRFRHERQILASLEHAHIARLLDGGMSDDGRPFLVMEYVEGASLDVYCDRHGLDIDSRLALFAEVCGAVQHAHQNLVVHRDLKPSNILVTEAGEPKLLDFGIATLLADEHASAPATRTSARVLTPEYASPEHLRGAPVTVASDVYALGVILYRLLTGRMPFERGRSGAAERFAAGVAADRPSTVVTRAAAAGGAPAAAARARATTPERLRRTLRGDLDSIVLRMLEADPRRRYGSVEQVLDDLRRHAAGLPVLAQAATARYRALKFLRRNRGATAAAALFVLLLGGFATVTTFQQFETARERDRAGLERDKAAEVATFLESLLAASDPFAPEPQRSDTLRVRDFLARGAVRVRQELAAQPLVQAQMLDVMGRVYRKQGLFDDARPLLEDALEIRRRVHHAAHPDVAASLASLAALLMSQGDYEAAQLHFEEALEINSAALGPRHALVAVALNDLATALRARGRFGEAEQRHQSALAILRDTPADREHRAVTLSDLATTLEESGEYRSAERYRRASLTLRRSLYGDVHPHVAMELADLALLLQRRGEYDEAEVLVRESLEIAHATLGREHPRVADLLNRLASILYWKGDLAEAAELHGTSLALKRRLYGDLHPQVAVGLYNFAQVLRRSGDFDAAEAANREALAILHATLGEDHPWIAIHTGGLATTLMARGDCSAAEPLFRRAIAGVRRTLPADRNRVPLLQGLLGRCLIDDGRHSEAEALLLESHAALRDGRAGEEFARNSIGELVALYDGWDRPEEAARYRAELASRSP